MPSDLRSLFLQVADLAPAERNAWFDREGIAPSLRDEIESLLLFDTSRSSLTECVSTAAAEFVNTGPATGQLCGAYKLVRLLGRGGMGAVFLAERHDGE